MRHSILVLDDDEAMARYESEILRQGGLEVVTTYRAEDAIRMIESGARFDLAILDVVMPKIGGESVSRILRLHDPDAKVLFVTGYSDVLFQARPVLWADESFLEKPFSPQGLMEAVWLLLHGHTTASRPSALSPKP